MSCMDVPRLSAWPERCGGIPIRHYDELNSSRASGIVIRLPDYVKPQMFERASIAGRFKSEASSLHVPCGIKKIFFYKITRVAWKIRVGRVTGTTGSFFWPYQARRTGTLE